MPTRLEQRLVAAKFVRVLQHCNGRPGTLLHNNQGCEHTSARTEKGLRLGMPRNCVQFHSYMRPLYSNSVWLLQDLCRCFSTAIGCLARSCKTNKAERSGQHSSRHRKAPAVRIRLVWSLWNSCGCSSAVQLAAHVLLELAQAAASASADPCAYQRAHGYVWVRAGALKQQAA